MVERRGGLVAPDVETLGLHSSQPALVEGQPVTLTPIERDRLDRLVARVGVPQGDLAEIDGEAELLRHEKRAGRNGESNESKRENAAEDDQNATSRPRGDTAARGGASERVK